MSHFQVPLVLKINRHFCFTMGHYAKEYGKWVGNNFHIHQWMKISKILKRCSTSYLNQIIKSNLTVSNKNGKISFAICYHFAWTFELFYLFFLVFWKLLLCVSFGSIFANRSFTVRRWFGFDFEKLISKQQQQQKSFYSQLIETSHSKIKRTKIRWENIWSPI